MGPYERQALKELQRWQNEMQLKPSLAGRIAKGVQKRINRIIPDRIHRIITTAIKQMVRAVIFGAGFTTPRPKTFSSLYELETLVRKRIRFYRSTAAAEGAVTGAGGFLWGFADFPLWLSLKMKMLFELASIYGLNVKDYKERLFLLYVFHLTFSSQKHRNKIYNVMAQWEKEKEILPDDINQFDWKTFQLEYRDYLDLAKLLQLIPGFGAVVGAYVNHRLTNRLGNYAMNAFRMRKSQSMDSNITVLTDNK